MSRRRRLGMGVSTLTLLLAVVLAGGSLVATAQAGLPLWTAGPFGTGPSVITGFIDAPSNGASITANTAVDVSGWVVDQTAQGWAGIDAVQVYDGHAFEGTNPAKFLASAQFALARNDVGAVLGNPYWSASGFRATIPAGSLAAGAHTLTVYAHSPGKGWWLRDVSVTVTAPAPTPTPTVSATATATPGAITYGEDPLLYVTQPSDGTSIPGDEDSYDIRGWAIDRNAGSGQGTGVDKVEVFLDGERGSGKDLGDADYGKDEGSGGDYGSQFARSGWDRSFKPTDYSSGEHKLYVYAHSSVTDRETLVKVTFTIRENN